MDPNRSLIEIRVQRIEQLFDTLDPSPFREKSLDARFEDYLRGCADEFAADSELRLVLLGPAEMAAHASDVTTAIRKHFEFLLQQHDRRIRVLRRRHRAVVLAGVVVLAGSLSLRQLLVSWPGPGGAILAEGLLVLGWVALWRPIEALLFDRHSAREERSLLQRLARIEVVWHPQPASG